MKFGTVIQFTALFARLIPTLQQGGGVCNDIVTDNGRVVGQVCADIVGENLIVTKTITDQTCEFICHGSDFIHSCHQVTTDRLLYCNLA